MDDGGRRRWMMVRGGWVVMDGDRSTLPFTDMEHGQQGRQEGADDDVACILRGCARSDNGQVASHLVASLCLFRNYISHIYISTLFVVVSSCVCLFFVFV